MGFLKNIGNGILDAVGNSATGGLSSAVSGLVNGVIGSIFRPSLRQQINSQKELMQEQSRLNRENYDYQFDKTSPANMVQLYRNAGLNPGLMYSGNAGSGVRANMGTSSTGSLSPFNGQAFTDPTMIASIQNTQADTNLKDSTADLTNEKVNTEKLIQLNKELEVKQRELDLAKTDDQRNKLKAEIDMINAQKDNIIAQTTTENELRDSRKRQIENDAELSRVKALTEEIMREYQIENYKSQTKLNNARAWRETINAKFEDVHHYSISSNSGISGLINRASSLVFGTPKFQDWVTNVGNGTYDEHNAVSALVKTFQSVFNEDKELWELFFPLASVIYRIAKANF